jgi:hypothetical protein
MGNSMERSYMKMIQNKIRSIMTSLVWLMFCATLQMMSGCGGGGSGSSTPAPPTPTYLVTGTISGATAPLTVLITKAGTGSSTSKATDDSGAFTVSLPDGSYTVTSDNLNYGFDPVLFTVAGSAQTIPNIPAYRVYTLSGSVHLADSTPFPGATMTLYKASTAIYEVTPPSGLYGATVALGTVVKAVSSGIDGSYTISGIRSGTYLLTPSRSGYVFNPEHTATFSITGTGNDVYLYDPERTGNTVIGDIIYNSRMPMAGNVLTLNFAASIPGGTGTP